MHVCLTGRAAQAIRLAALAIVALVALAVTLDATADLQGRAPVVDLTPEGVAKAASKYVADYQKAFAFLVADEDYQQQLIEDDLPTQMRHIEGELFMTYLPVDDEWITVHDVATVDGRPLADREDLRLLLRAGDVRGVVDRVANRNAAFNIGTIIRNFNEPTLPLLLLTAKRLENSRFRRVRMQKDMETTVVTLSFEERERPTLVTSATGGPVYSKGELVIEANTGRVRETTLELEDGRVKARLVTTYAPEERLDLWVPVSFKERYERNHRGGKREVVTGESTYSNYRRFEGTGRIK
jgi:hypothetical protein